MGAAVVVVAGAAVVPVVPTSATFTMQFPLPSNMYPMLHEYVHADAPVVGVTVANGFESHTAGLNPSGQYVLPVQSVQACVSGSMNFPKAQWHAEEPMAELWPVGQGVHVSAVTAEY